MKNVGLGLSIFTLLLGITLALNLPAWSEKAGEQEPGTVAPPEITMEEAIKAATEKVPGKVTEAELEAEDGKTIFEITVVGEDGKEVEVEVDGTTGAVTVAPPEITMEQAIEAATEKVPGKVTEAELEDEDGKTIFEITVVGENGREVEVEVDAATGVAMVEDEEKEDDEKEDD